MNKLIIIDDDIDLCELIADIFTDKMQVAIAHDYDDKCLSTIIKLDPQVILLDINLPSAKGFTIAEEILIESPQSKIIFISGLATLKDKQKAFKAGGFDYIDKPFDVDTLTTKVDIAIRAFEQELENNERLKNIRNSMFEAMTQASELGSLLRFTDQASQCNNVEDLSKEFFSLLEEMNLHSSLLISLSNNHEIFFNDEIERPLEREILTTARHAGRLVDFGAHTLVNEESVSLLIRNMPIDDENRYGMIKDNICFIISSVQTKVKQLIIEKELKIKERHFYITNDVLTNIIMQLEENNLQFTAESTRLLEDLSTDMRDEFTSLSITETEESRIMQTLTTCSDNMDVLFTRSSETDQNIRKILHDLLTIYKKP